MARGATSEGRGTPSSKNSFAAAEEDESIWAPQAPSFNNESSNPSGKPQSVHENPKAQSQVVNKKGAEQLERLAIAQQIWKERVPSSQVESSGAFRVSPNDLVLLSQMARTLGGGVPQRPQWKQLDDRSAKALHRAERQAVRQWRRGLYKLAEESSKSLGTISLNTHSSEEENESDTDEEKTRSSSVSNGQPRQNRQRGRRRVEQLYGRDGHWTRLQGTGVVANPFEIDVQFWRELWRAIEQADLCVWVVDIRFPSAKFTIKQVGEKCLEALNICYKKEN